MTKLSRASLEPVKSIMATLLPLRCAFQVRADARDTTVDLPASTSIRSDCLRFFGSPSPVKLKYNQTGHWTSLQTETNPSRGEDRCWGRGEADAARDAGFC